MTDWCQDLVSPHSHGASLVYTVVRLYHFHSSQSHHLVLLQHRLKGNLCDFQVIGLPTLLFLVFLGWRFMPSIRKLQTQQSHIMTTYYAFLWIVGLLNLLRCFALIVEAQFSSPFILNVLWLMTRFGELKNWVACQVNKSLTVLLVLRSLIAKAFSL